MSTPSDHAALRVESRIGSVQMSLIDSTFAEVASGPGLLVADDLRPGIYELRLSAGVATDTRLISLRAGDAYSETVDLSFPAAVPLPGTTTWNERHQIAATRGSEHIAQTRDPGRGGLLVMVRGTNEGEEAPTALGFELIRGSEAIGKNDESWWRSVGPDWLVQAAAVEPGGYCLRTRSGGATVEQSLWVVPGWQTLVFVPSGPEGPVPSQATILMFSIDQPWNPERAEHTAAAAELALAGLRERRTVLPPDFLDLLLDEKFKDPMLGVLGAHSLLLEPEIDFERFDIVMSNLDQLMPAAPDVVALWVLGDEARDERDRQPVKRQALELDLEWPPMLVVAYAALIRLDAWRHGGVILPGSPAETVAGQLIGDGIWTAWTAQRPPRSPTRKRRERARSQRQESVLGDELREVEAAGPVTQRVASYLGSVADAEGPSSLDAMLAGDLGQPRNVAAATSVPLRSVKEAIDAIKDDVE